MQCGPECLGRFAERQPIWDCHLSSSGVDRDAGGERDVGSYDNRRHKDSFVHAHIYPTSKYEL